MDGSTPCGGGNDRRRFLKATAATGAALATADTLLAQAPDAPKASMPTITLGKTGATVSRLGMGTSWEVAPGFVQAAIAAGVRYIDSSEAYTNGKAEEAVGLALERSGARKDVYLVTKCSEYRNARGPSAAKVFEEHLAGSLKRLRTDYVDAYYIHGIKGNQIPMLKDAGVKAAFETLKSEKKIRFAGLSCHDAMLPEVVEAVAEAGWLDQIMIQFNFRTMNGDAIRRAVDKASKANIGLVAMKTQVGADAFKDVRQADSPRITALVEKGFSVPQAAIKAVFADERFHVVVSEMTNRDQLKENMASTRDPLTAKQARLLEEHRSKTANLYCHGCGHLCETAAHGVPVADVLRYLRYYESYGKRQEARALYAALPPIARAMAASADLAAAEAACPHGLPVAGLIKSADARLA